MKAPIPADQTSWKQSLMGLGPVIGQTTSMLPLDVFAEKLKSAVIAEGFTVTQLKAQKLEIRTGNALIKCSFERSATSPTKITISADRDYSLPLPVLIPSILSFGFILIRCIQTPGGKINVDPLTFICMMIFLGAVLFQEKKKVCSTGDIRRFKKCLEKALQ